MNTALRLVDPNSTRRPTRRITFTATALAGLIVPTGRATVYDEKTPGLAYVKSSSGASAYYLIRRINGRAQRIRLGSGDIGIPTARKLASKANGQVAQGIDPALDKRALRDSATLQELFDRWRAENTGKLSDRTIATDVSRFDTCFVGWKSRTVASISNGDVRAIHTRLGAERGQVTANRAVQLLRKLYNHARLPNPASKAVEMYREQSRERFISPAEMPHLFAALEKMGTMREYAHMRDFVLLCLYTGARKSNVLAMHASELDLTAGVWTIPAAKAKANDSIRIPLVPQAVEILRQRSTGAAGWVFPGEGATGHLVDVSAAWETLTAAAGLPDLHIHDLRRTFGSWQASAGASLPIIGRSLGHSSPSATAIYSRLQIDSVRASVNAAADAIQSAGAQ